MDVSIVEAKNHLAELIRAVEDGEKVVITRHGKPVAQLTPPPRERREVQWGAMRDRIRLLPGWDDPIDFSPATCEGIPARHQHRAARSGVARAHPARSSSGNRVRACLSQRDLLLGSAAQRYEREARFDPRAWWPDALDKLTATPIPLRPNHISEVYFLPPIHQDPFDRMLIAQAKVEDLTLVTTDSDIPKYASARFRVLS